MKRIYRGGCVTSHAFLSLLPCEDTALPPLEDMATKCHLGSRQCPHQKVQPVDVLILDFFKLTEIWKIWCFSIFQTWTFCYGSTNRWKHYIPQSERDTPFWVMFVTVSQAESRGQTINSMTGNVRTGVWWGGTQCWVRGSGSDSCHCCEISLHLRHTDTRKPSLLYH